MQICCCYLLLLFFPAYFWGTYYYKKDWSDVDGKKPVAFITFSFSLSWILLSNANVNEVTQMLTLQFGASFQRDRISTWHWINCWGSHPKKYTFGSHFTDPHLPLSIGNNFFSGILLTLIQDHSEQEYHFLSSRLSCCLRISWLHNET